MPISAREVALQTLLAVETEAAYANLALRQQLARHRLDDRERALATELVYGAVKSLNTIDWVLEPRVKKGLASLPAPIRAILRLGVYQLLYLDRVPPAAVVDEAVKLARRYGHQGTAALVNAVLRGVSRGLPLELPSRETNLVDYLVLKYSHPRWLVTGWLAQFGEAETEALLAADNQAPVTALRANTLRVSREELRVRLAAEGVAARESRMAPEGLVLESQVAVAGLAGYREGLFQVQDEASQLVAHVVAPARGGTVVDACAGPGGKASHLAQLMQNQGRVLALDVHPHKLDLIHAACERLGIGIVETVLLDARVAGERLAGMADWVLVDAPCSGLGVLRRRPDARWRKEPRQVRELHELQLEILEGCLPCLKPGGVLVYSTCSLAAEENGQVFAEFGARHRELAAEDLNPLLPFELAREEDREQARRGSLQLLPHRHGADGFFLARWRLLG